MKGSVDGRMLWWKLLVVLLVFWTGTAVAWEGTVHRVQDGDSFQVKRGQATVTVRLYGIDCPEYGQPFGEEAKRAASGMMQGKKVVFTLDLGAGDGEATAWGCDLTYDYVKINGDYRT